MFNQFQRCRVGQSPWKEDIRQPFFLARGKFRPCQLVDCSNHEGLFHREPTSMRTGLLCRSRRELMEVCLFLAALGWSCHLVLHHVSIV